ncbi:MAG TPA: hypothetical protein VGN88_04415 [Phycisphaerae bacterium]|jgi:hypothetical protein
MDPAPEESRKHPTSAKFTAEEIARMFVRHTHQHIPDARWHFEIALREGSRLISSEYSVPAPGGPLVSLALFNCPEQPFSVEVFGMHLLHEIDPADWLDVYIESVGIFEIMSRRRVSTPAGDLGDLLVRWDYDNKTFVGRMACLKAGARLILLSFRTAEPEYPVNADIFFTTLMNFQLLDQSGGPLAESVQYASNQWPHPWRVAVPSSWQIVEQPTTPAMATLQFLLPVKLEKGTVTAGKITFSVVESRQLEMEQQAFNSVNETLKAAGISAESGLFFPEPDPKNGVHSWILRTQGTLQNQPMEINARVMQHPRGWVIVIAFGPPREQSPAYWMQVKRTVDVLTMSMEFV